MADRLISADVLKELIANHVYPVVDDFNSRDYGMFWTGGIEKAIDDVPTVDAVEVVRCKDCKWFEISHLKRDGTVDKRYTPSVCVRGTFAKVRKADWYCADGERREDG